MSAKNFCSQKKALSGFAEQGLFELSPALSEHGNGLAADYDDEAHDEDPDDHQGGGSILNNRDHPRFGMGEKSQGKTGPGITTGLFYK